MSDYSKPKWYEINLNFEVGYTKRPNKVVHLEFDQDYFKSVGVFSASIPGLSTIPSPSIKLKSDFLRPLSAGNLTAFGKPGLSRAGTRLYVNGIDNTIQVSTPKYVSWRKFISADEGIKAQESFYSVSRVRMKGGYSSPPQSSIALNWFETNPYSPPPPHSVTLEFGALGYGYIFASAGLAEAFGTPTVSKSLVIHSNGFDSQKFGLSWLYRNNAFIYTIGVQSSDFGKPNFKKNTDYATPLGFVDTHFSSPKIYNLKQIIVLNGFYDTLFGKPFLGGGVRYLTVYGFNSSGFGTTQVTNTRADQYAIALGILGLSIGSPNVSPRYIRPIDISPPIFPQPLVQRSPYPLGLDHSSYGNTTLWFRVRYLSPAGILGFDSGYAKIFDPTQFIYANPPQTSAVFGDIKAKNKNIIVYAQGVLASAVNEWAVFENTLRLINAKGIDSFSTADANIRNKTPSIMPDGFISPIGEPSIADRVRRVNVVGIPYLFFGLPTLTTPPSLVPKGGDYLRFGDTFVSLKIRTMFVGGAYSLSIGSATVWPWSRNVAIDGIKAPILTSASTVTHGLRELLPNGSDSMKFSASHWLSFRIRTIIAESIVDNKPNTAHRVSRNIIIYPAGFDATEWGKRIIPESKTLLPIGIAPSAGTPAIDWFIRSLYPNGFKTSFNAEKNTDIRFGTARAFNKTQYIVQFFDVASGLVPQDFSQWTAIEVRNKTILTYGVDAKKIGYALISNNAVQISPVGIQGDVGTPFVGYRVRSVFADAIDSPYIANWNVIHNAAFVVAPISKNTDAFGVHRLFSNLQTLKANGAEMSSYGYHMVDFAIRTLQMESRYGIYPAYINLPNIQLHTRYISPMGFDPSTLWASNVGMPDLAIHRNIISPKWTDRQYLWWGDAVLKNLTPELGVYGNANELFGITSVRTQWENVFTKGDESLLLGKALIEFKTRKIAVAGLNAVPISQLHKVIKLGAPPYSTQYIDLSGWSQRDGVLEEADGYGIEPPDKQVANPALNQSVIYPEGFMTAKFGDTRVTANALKIDAGIYILGVASPSVGLKVREVVVEGIDNYIGKGRIGKPRITPHTIYAPFGDEATEQARRNHPVDTLILPVNTGVKFGGAMVINKNRVLRHYNVYKGDSFGTQSLMLSRQYIKPNGMRSEKSGWHSIPFSLQTVTQLHEDNLDSFQQFGGATIARPPYLGSYTIKILGGSHQLFGAAELQNSIRFLRPIGLASTAMGAKKTSDSPFMWQGLRIGELVLGKYGGDEHSVLGLPFISAKVRDIGAEGFDAFLSEYDIYNFKTRMRVYRQAIPTEKDYIQAMAANAAEFGNAKITHGHYFIRPDGNSETYRQGIG